jgi:hypothetical protein
VGLYPSVVSSTLTVGTFAPVVQWKGGRLPSGKARARPPPGARWPRSKRLRRRPVKAKKWVRLPSATQTKMPARGRASDETGPMRRGEFLPAFAAPAGEDDPLKAGRDRAGIGLASVGSGTGARATPTPRRWGWTLAAPWSGTALDVTEGGFRSRSPSGPLFLVRCVGQGFLHTQHVCSRTGATPGRQVLGRGQFRRGWVGPGPVLGYASAHHWT